ALLKAKADVSKRDSSGSTAVSFGAVSGSPSILRALLNSRVDPEIVNDAFIVAARTGHAELLRILREKGDDIKKVGSVALLEATGGEHKIDPKVSENSRVEVIKFLLSNGAGTNERTSLKDTPLHMAVERGYGSVVRVLLNSGADINAKGFRGRT